RHGHDDGDRASVPDDRAVRRGSVGGSTAGELVAPPAWATGGSDTDQLAGDGGDEVVAASLLHHVLHRRGEQVAGCGVVERDGHLADADELRVCAAAGGVHGGDALVDAQPLAVGDDAHGGGVGDGGAGADVAVFDLGPALAVALHLRLGHDA